MALVLDASVALAWCFPDESNTYADALLHCLGVGDELDLCVFRGHCPHRIQCPRDLDADSFSAHLSV